MKRFSRIVVAFSLVAGPSAFAAPAWETPLQCFHAATGAGLIIESAITLCHGASSLAPFDCFREAYGILTQSQAVLLCAGAMPCNDPFSCYELAVPSLTSEDAIRLCRATP
jgi:hypothetical protein